MINLLSVLPCMGRQRISITEFNYSGQCKWFNDSIGCRCQPPSFKGMDEDSIKEVDKFCRPNREWLEVL